MNYCILNNRSSLDISGLLIQSLPSISKPLMRTMVEEIDGRDGDIITKLGYSAYDKEMEIGLHGDFDINDVISFFDSEGEVTFSNEPDKVYRYTILEQIDFERLIRYRTATVTFHVQPFKYLLNEEEIETTTGGDITVVNGGNIPARPTITVYGEGNVSISLNGTQAFQIAFTDEEYITIDTAEYNATYGGILKNRQVTGDYSAFSLPVGTSTLNVSGTVTSVQISNYNRWL